MTKTLLNRNFLYLFLMQICFILSATLLTGIVEIIVPKANHLAVLNAFSLWGAPFLLVVTFLYFWTTNRHSPQKALAIFLYGFGGFFLLCALSIYPYYEVMHVSPHMHVALLKKYPGFGGLVDLYKQWPETFLCLGAESFYFIFVNVFFWQTVIQVTNPKDAKIIYPLFGFLAGILFLISGPIGAFLLAHKNVYSHPYWTVAILIALNAAALLCQRKVLEKESSKQEAVPILESFGYIFTASDFYLVIALTFLFFGMTGLAFFFKSSYSFLLWTLYGFIQLGYLLLPKNIQAKSKAIIDILLSAFSLWAIGALLKAGFTFHLLKKMDMKTFTMVLGLTFIGTLIVLSYVLCRKLKAKKIW